MVDEPAEAQGQALEENAEPKKKPKIFLVLFLGLSGLILAGGAFFAYTKFMAQIPAVTETEDQDTTEMPKDAVGEMYLFEPFVVNLSDPKGKRYLKVKLGVEVETAETVAKVEKAVPKLRDMVIMMLTSLTFEEVMTPEGKVQIRDELLERFNQIMRPTRIKNIYFTEFVVQ